MSSNNEVVTVPGLHHGVDVSDAAGQQPFSDGTIGIAPSTVQPANISTPSQALDGQQSKLVIEFNVSFEPQLIQNSSIALQ